MCGRFTATFEFSDIRVRWNLDRDLAKYKPRFNIAPWDFPDNSRHRPSRSRQQMQTHAMRAHPVLGERPDDRKPDDKRLCRVTYRETCVP
jgi:putative SOS response-associated peptidase YedK